MHLINKAGDNMAEGAVSFTIDSEMFHIFDIKSCIKGYVEEFIKEREGLGLDIICAAYESTMMEVTAILPYTFNFEEGSSVADYSFGAINIEMSVETDISTLFDIHKDVWCKYKESFAKWLSKHSCEYDCIPETIEEFYTKLCGVDTGTAFAVFLSFYVEEVAGNCVDLFKQTFSDYVEQYFINADYDDEEESDYFK